MVSENSTKMPLFIGLIALIFILISAVVWYFFRGVGVLKMIMYLTIFCFIATIIFLIVYAVFWLFMKHPIDAVHVNKERIIQSAKANAPATTKMLYFKGNDEWEYKFIGYITGVCQISRRTNNNGIIKEDIEDCICFVKNLGFFSRLFGHDEVVRVLKQERSSLNSDKVFLNAMSFAPEKFGFYFLPNRWRDENVRTQVSREVHDVTLQEVLKEEVNIVNDAIAISPRHQKELEKSNMQQIQNTSGK